MPSGDEKRQKIIADQAAREAADRASGKLPPVSKPRKNWAAGSAPRRGRPSNSWGKPKPKPEPQ